MTNIFTYIQQFFLDFFLILNEMSPYLLLGLLFAGLLKVFLPERFIAKYLRKNNTRSAVNATLLGVPLPLCSCGVLPTGISLYKNGASKGATNAFITATPQTGVDSILVTYAMLGLPMAIIRPIVALISGVLSGILTNKLTINEKSNASNVTENIQCAENNQEQNFAQRCIAVLKYAFITFLSDIAKWLIIGTLIAAFISVLLPNDFFTTYISHGALGILIILIASMPLYICATASVPIAAVLLSKGISPGAILVFLMAGPATNAASFTLIGKTLGKRSLVAYLVTIIGAAVGFGILMDAFLPIEWFQVNSLAHHVHEETGWLFWFQTTCTLFLICCIVYIYTQKTIEKRKPMTQAKDSKIYQVPDVSCNHCKKSLEDTLRTQSSVEEATVHLAQKTLEIKGDISDQEIEKIVTELGFTYEGRI